MAINRTFEKLFFQLCLCDFNLDSLVNLLLVSLVRMICIVFDGCREEGVDKGSLAETRLARNLARR